MWQSKWVALDKRSQVSLTFGTYIKPMIRLNISCKYYDLSLSIIELEDLKVLRHSSDLFTNVKIGQGQLQLIIKHILFYHIWGLLPFWSSDWKQSNEYSIKQPSDFWETNVYIGMWQSKWVAFDKKSQVSLTFGTYIKPLSHKVKHFSKVLWSRCKQL